MFETIALTPEMFDKNITNLIEVILNETTTSKSQKNLNHLK
jgi:hypothetical protein